MVILFHYSRETGELTGSSEAQKDPRESARQGKLLYLIDVPFSTTTAPPSCMVGQIPVFRDGEWEVEEDHRGTAIFAKDSGIPSIMTVIGPIPEDFTTITPPGPDYLWSETDGWTPDIDKMIEKALLQVDAAAEAKRGAFMTQGSGQAMTYLLKMDEAVKIKADSDPELSEYPLLSNEVGVTAETLQEVADIIIANNAAWVAAGAEIERVRLLAKKRLRTATTSGEITRIVAEASQAMPTAS